MTDWLKRLARQWVVKPPRLYRALYPHALWRVETPCEAPKTVYLTFDDGPSPHTTPFILEQLRQAGFKATFFVVGQNAQRYPHLIHAIRNEGHVVGNHTMRHIQGLKTNADAYIEDVDNENLLLGTTLFRPPHGLMKPGQYSALKNKYRIVMFDIVTRDYDAAVSTHDIQRAVERNARPGSIIVIHDSLTAEPRLREALPRVLKWLIHHGYSGRSIPVD